MNENELLGEFLRTFRNRMKENGFRAAYHKPRRSNQHHHQVMIETPLSKAMWVTLGIPPDLTVFVSAAPYPFGNRGCYYPYMKGTLADSGLLDRVVNFFIDMRALAAKYDIRGAQ